MQQHVLLATWMTDHWSDVASVVSIVIAFVAAFRPELHALLRPRRVEIFLSDSLFLEIGFVGMGPTLGLVGTLDNEHARSLIRSMRVCVKLVGGNDEFVLTPIVNRERAFNSALATGEEGRGKFWLPFLIDADVAVPFDVLFRNDAATATLTSTIVNLGQAWTAYANAKVGENEKALTGADQMATQQNVASFLVALYNAAGNEEFITKAARELSDAFVWKAGTYDARLEVEVPGCPRPFTRRFRFDLSAEQRAQLFDNTNLIMAIVCKQIDAKTDPNATYSRITIQD